MLTFVLDVLYDVFGSQVLLHQFQECLVCGWSWPPCSPDMNPCDYFLSSYITDCVSCTNSHAVQELQVETEVAAKRSASP
jgi:hypothetical protein